MKTTRFTVGLNTCFSSTRWPLPEDKFRIVNSLGIDTVQYSLDALGTSFLEKHGKAYAKRIRNAAEKMNITIHSTFTGADAHFHNFLMHHDFDQLSAEKEWFRQAILFAAGMGARGFGAFFGAMSIDADKDQILRKALIQQYIDGVIELADYAAKCGLEFLMVEPMSIRREFPCTLAETQQLLDSTHGKARIPILLTLDVGHHAVESHDCENDRDPYKWLERFSPHSPAIHIHQTDLIASRHWSFIEENNRKGIIKPEQVIKSIKKSGAEDVLLVIELFHSFYEPQDESAYNEINESIKFWKDAVNRYA